MILARSIAASLWRLQSEQKLQRNYDRSLPLEILPLSSGMTRPSQLSLPGSHRRSNCQYETHHGKAAGETTGR